MSSPMLFRGSPPSVPFTIDSPNRPRRRMIEAPYATTDHVRLGSAPASPVYSPSRLPDPSLAHKVATGAKLTAEERLIALYHPEMCTDVPPPRRAVALYGGGSVAQALTFSGSPVAVPPPTPKPQPTEKPFVSSKKVFTTTPVEAAHPPARSEGKRHLRPTDTWADSTPEAIARPSRKVHLPEGQIGRLGEVDAPSATPIARRHYGDTAKSDAAQYYGEAPPAKPENGLPSLAAPFGNEYNHGTAPVRGLRMVPENSPARRSSADLLLGGEAAHAPVYAYALDRIGQPIAAPLPSKKRPLQPSGSGHGNLLAWE
eukprot:EG_transcript_20368